MMNVNDIYEGWVNNGRLDPFNLLKFLDSLDDGREGAWRMTLHTTKHKCHIKEVVWLPKNDFFGDVHSKRVISDDGDTLRCVIESYVFYAEEREKEGFILHPKLGYVERMSPSEEEYNRSYYENVEQEYPKHREYYSYKGWQRCTIPN